MQLSSVGDSIGKYQTALMYGGPGVGKTTAISLLKGKTLIIDVDLGTRVLTGKHDNIKIARLSPSLADIPELLSMLEKDCPFDNIALDGLSELERAMLAILGRTGKNGGAPELGHYNQVGFRITDLCRRLRILPANIVFTAWEEYRDVVDLGGEKYSKARPMLSGKLGDNICGICDIVGQMLIDPESSERYIRLKPMVTLTAKDRFLNRTFCKPIDFLNGEEKENAAVGL